MQCPQIPGGRTRLVVAFNILRKVISRHLVKFLVGGMKQNPDPVNSQFVYHNEATAKQRQIGFGNCFKLCHKQSKQRSLLSIRYDTGTSTINDSENE